MLLWNVATPKAKTWSQLWYILSAGTATMHESELRDLLRIGTSEMKVFSLQIVKQIIKNLPRSTQTCTFAISTTALKKARKSFAAKVTGISRK